jgi:hypothetical protein
LLYDDVDDEVLRSFHEMSLANLIFYAMKEGACSEQSSRMTAMDAASKNAGEQQIGGNHVGCCGMLLAKIDKIVSHPCICKKNPWGVIH